MIPAGARRERISKLFGLVLFLALLVAGAAILAAYFAVPALIAPDSSLRFGAMEVGALLALPPLVLYLWAPRIVGRLDPEPWWSLVLASSFGAFAGSGMSALCNSLFEEGIVAMLGGAGADPPGLAYVISACVGAPLIEELWKGLPVLFAFWLLRPGLDGVAEGVMYATFSAFGFAAMENVVYYARAALDEVTHKEEGALAAMFMMRGVLSPWGHPLYTAMIGLGFGMARESSRPWAKRLLPLIGYLGAVALHAIWNASAMLSDDFTRVLLPLCIVLIVGFIALVAGLAARHVRIIREHLGAEVSAGTLTREELALVVSPFARLRATLSHGGIVGQRFVATAARLAFCRWHAARGNAHRCRTGEPIEALRLELGRLRIQMHRRVARPQSMSPLA